MKYYILPIKKVDKEHARKRQAQPETKKRAELKCQK